VTRDWLTTLRRKRPAGPEGLPRRVLFIGKKSTKDVKGAVGDDLLSTVKGYPKGMAKDAFEARKVLPVDV
jgi:hypothetical protein